jgi:nucleotide-binding universal stress UspA family protein
MNFPFNKILCPVGFDDQEGVALEASKQLGVESTTVYLLHVVSALPAMGEPQVAKTRQDEKSSETKALTMLKELAVKRLSGVRYETLTETAFLADTGKAILAVAREVQPDLIVMPTHGRSGLARLVMGSVTERVVREALCPVLTIRTSEGWI